jgi:hypothetical protein
MDQTQYIYMTMEEAQASQKLPSFKLYAAIRYISKRILKYLTRISSYD